MNEGHFFFFTAQAALVGGTLGMLRENVRVAQMLTLEPNGELFGCKQKTFFVGQKTKWKSLADSKEWALQVDSVYKHVHRTIGGSDGKIPPGCAGSLSVYGTWQRWPMSIGTCDPCDSPKKWLGRPVTVSWKPGGISSLWIWWASWRRLDPQTQLCLTKAGSWKNCKQLCCMNLNKNFGITVIHLQNTPPKQQGGPNKAEVIQQLAWRVNQLSSSCV